MDFTDPSATAAVLQRKPALVLLESPSNPLLRITDLPTVIDAAHAAGATVAVDNTFLSPALQRPIELGADIVIHSTTKYLNGHSDVIGGIAVVGGGPRLDALREQLAFLHNAIGAIAGPFDSYLALRGVKTLAVRMQRHCENAIELAGWLERDARVRRVRYPGLASHPQHALAKRQMRAFGGMITFDLASDLAGTLRFLEACELITLAESLGGVESLIEHPAIMTHASIPAERREKIGIVDTLVRLSVGIEDLADLRADLENALAQI